MESFLTCSISFSCIWMISKSFRNHLMTMGDKPKDRSQRAEDNEVKWWKILADTAMHLNLPRTTFLWILRNKTSYYLSHFL